MARSCKKCGFFVRNSTFPKRHIGYCLYFEPEDIEEKEPPKKLKIIAGEEEAIAGDCKGYINTVDYL